MVMDLMVMVVMKRKGWRKTRIFIMRREVDGGGDTVLLGGVLHVHGFLCKYFGDLC
jgi:hypothetical protein